MMLSLSRISAVLAAGALLAVPALASAPAYAAGAITHSVTVAYAGTGYGTADECALAADTSATDLVSCTNDSIGYVWNYNVTGSAEPTVATFSQTVPAGFRFDASNVTLCEGSPSTFTGTGSITTHPDGSQTLACVITFPAGGSLAGDLPISVLATGALANGTVLAPALTVTPQGGLGVDALPSPVTIVAEPTVDLVKGMDLLAQGPDLYDGRDGYLILVSQALIQKNPSGQGDRKGAEQLATPVTWTDDLSGMPVGSELVFAAAGGYSTAGASPADCLGDTVYGFPFNEGARSATVNCAQAAPGQPIEFTVSAGDLSGADTSGPFYRPGVILSAGFMLFVPAESVPQVPTGTLYSNQLLDFDPDSLSGQSNYADGYEFGGAPGDECDDPMANNNCAGVQLFNGVAAAPSGAKWLAPVECDRFVAPGESGNTTDVALPEYCPSYPVSGGTGGFPAHVTPDEPFWSQLNVILPLGGFENFTGVTLCDKWDPAEQRLDPSRPVTLRNLSVAAQYDQTVVEVQYTTADYTDQADRASAGCGIPGDDVTDGPWFDDIASAGGVAAISGVRLIHTAPAGLVPGSNLWAYVPVVNVAAESAVPKVDQFAIRWDGSAAVTSENPSGTYPVLAASYVVVRSQTSITKDTVPSLTTVGAGNTVAYRLTPSFTSSDPDPESETVTVVDALPSCAINPQAAPGTSSDWSLAVTPADPGPDGIACSADDVSGAVLTFTSTAPRVPDEPLAPIDYTVVIAPNVTDLASLTNTATVSSPGSIDIPQAYRTSAKTVLVRAAAQITIVKAVDQPVVEITPDTIGWTVTVANTSTVDAGSTQWIDVLPFVGDGRGTDYSGTLAVTGVTGLNAQLTGLEYTAAAPASISDDPLDVSNGLGGATAWCVEGDFGAPGCPAAWSEVTGIRFTVGAFSRGVVTGIHIAAAPQGNSEGDQYINQVGPGDSENIVESLPNSNPARVEVVASSIGDRVWIDSNADGIQDAGEPGLPGVTVTLHDGLGALVATTQTGVDGIYSFPGLHSGTYSVRVDASTVPVQYDITYDLDDGVTDPDGDSGAIELGVDSDFRDADFGYHQIDVSFDVTKVVDDETGFATGPYTVVVTCTLGGQLLPGYPETLVFDGAGSESRTVPRGAVCSAAETEDGGATEVVIDGPVTLTAEGGELLVTNQFRAGSLVIVKTLDGVGAIEYGDGPFVFDVSCDFQGDEILDDQITLQRSGSEATLTSDRLTGLPIGAICTISESDTGSADSTPAPVTVTIAENAQDDTVVAAFTNLFSAGSIAVTKVLQGSGAALAEATEAVFTVQVTCQLQVGDPATALTLFSAPLQVRGGETVIAEDADGDPVLLPLGTHCWGEETDAGAASDAVVDFTSYEDAAIVVDGAPSSLQALELTATNTFVAAELVVTKSVTGPGSPGPYRFAAACSREGEPVTLAPGDAEFELSAGESRTIVVVAGVDCEVTELDPPQGATVLIVDSDALSAGGSSDGLVTAITGGQTVAFTNAYRPTALGATGLDVLSAVGGASAVLAMGLFLLALRNRSRTVVRAR